MNFHKLAYLSIRYPKVIILIWTLFLIVFGYLAPKFPATLKDHGLYPDGAYASVQQILSSDFHIPKDPVILVFEKNKHVTLEQFQQFIQQTILQLQIIEGISEIVSPLQRKEMLAGNFAYAMFALDNHIQDMKSTLAEIQRSFPIAKAITVNITGKPVVQVDVNRASQHDLRQAEWIGVTAAFIILWFAFGGIVSAMVPIVIGLVGVTGTMGIMYGIGSKIELSNFVLNVIPMVGLALSIDFALMIVSRFREELVHKPPEQALLITLCTAGRAVLFSAISVFLGLMGILFIPLPMFSSIALGAMTILIVSVLLALTLVPALLFVMRRAIRSENKSFDIFTKRGWWNCASQYVMRRPARMGLLATCLLICCLLPLNKMELAIPDATSLPQGYNSRLAFETYQNQFGSPMNADVYLIAQVNADNMNKEEWFKVHTLIQKLESDPNVQKVDSVFSSLHLSPEQLYVLYQNPAIKAKYVPILQQFIQKNHMLLHITLKGTTASKHVMSWLRNWGNQGESSEISFLLGGEAKYQQEVFDAIFQHITAVLLFILVSNYVVLFMAFQSILIPLKTIVMNLLSLGASFGILTWTFEGGHFGIEPTSIAIMIPVFIFGLVFGISMDYGVFLVSRIFEVYQKTQDNGYAVRVGLASIRKIINAAAAIMIAVTVPFAFGEVAGVKQLGIGIAAAVFIDATIIRMILVPSLMKMLGKWNWWAPAILKR
ncbi:MMPL family transporter [Paenibacillus aestuarii]|uniref:MMPL family transporter n=1 Tax=Paenibacillus aestuarii TaxID=516965 RepID=A0ABW0KE01_9BACL|nr:MMPL family transporter [Paenibacillus aestuarii]